MWLGVAFDCSLYYVRDSEHLVRVMSTNPSCLRSAVDEKVKNLRDWGIPSAAASAPSSSGRAGRTAGRPLPAPVPDPAARPGNAVRRRRAPLLGPDARRAVPRRGSRGGDRGCILAGYSFGGSMAVEAARILEERGRPARRLYLVAPEAEDFLRLGPFPGARLAVLARLVLGGRGRS